MLGQDFERVGSTHELVVRLLASELGLRAVLSADSQHVVLVDCFEPLRERVLAQLRAEVELPLALLGESDVVRLSGARDAQLFQALYAPFNQFEVAADLLHRHVHPLIGRALRGCPELHAPLSRAVRRHRAQYGAAVGARMADTLSAFGLHWITLRTEG